MSSERQKIFNTSVLGLLRNPSVFSWNSEELQCVYDDGHGNHCAIGHLIRPEDQTAYDAVSVTEYGSAISVIGETQEFREKYPELISAFTVNELRKLQNAHDQLATELMSDNFSISDRIKAVITEYRRLAKLMDLEFPEAEALRIAETRESEGETA